MTETRGVYRLDDGLTPGIRKDGGWSSLGFGDSGLEGHGTFYPDALDDDGERDQEGSSGEGDEHSFTSSQVALGVIVIAGISVAATVAAPHVKRWVSDTALPGLRSRWNTIIKRENRPLEQPEPELVAVSEAVTREFSTAIEQTVEDPRELMSSSEAQRQLAELLIAAAAVAERVRRLSNAQIEDDPEFPAVKQAMDQLTEQSVVDAVNRMIRGEVSDEDDELIMELLRRFESRSAPSSSSPTLSQGNIRDTLRLEPREDEHYADGEERESQE